MKKRILIVEDDISIRDALSEVLEGEGYTVETAADGEEGLAKVISIRKPSLVLLDLSMPHVDGYQFIEKLLSIPNPPRVAIIIFTAARIEENSPRLRNLSLVRKPFDLEDLLATIHSKFPLQSI